MVKEQQTQIEAQAGQMEQQQAKLDALKKKEIRSSKSKWTFEKAQIERLSKKTAEVDGVKTLICGQRPGAAICKRRK